MPPVPKVPAKVSTAATAKVSTKAATAKVSTKAGKSGAEQIKSGAAFAQSKTSKTNRSGKPSVVGHAAAGAGTGAALGAVVGSVVPGVGTAIGAGVGAAAGGVAGGIGGGRAKADARRAGRSPGRQILVTEFIACVIVLALSPLTDKHKTDTPGDWMKRASGISALFVLLGLIGATGDRAAKAASAFGGLVLVVLLVTDRDIFTVIAKRFGGPTPDGPAGPPGDDQQPGPGEPETQPQNPTVSQRQQTAPRPRG